MKKNRRFTLLFTFLLIFGFILPQFKVSAKDDQIILTRGRDTSEIPGNDISTTGDAGFATATNALPKDAPAIQAKAAILVDIDTGDVLYKKNKDAKFHPGSLTKVATAYLVCDLLDLQENVKITMNAGPGDEDPAYIDGEELSVKSLLYGMFDNGASTPSENLARLIGGDKSFSDVANERLSSLGLTSTQIMTPDGSDDNTVTTVDDMAFLGRYAYQKDSFRSLLRDESYTIPANKKSGSRTVWSQNQMIYAQNGDIYYEKSTGGRPGYTEKDGFSYIAFAENDGRRVVYASYGYEDQDECYKDAIKIFQFGFNNYSLCQPLTDYQVTLAEANTSDANVTDKIKHNYFELDTRVELEYYVNQNPFIIIRNTINGDELVKTISMNDKIENSVAGKVLVTYGGKELVSSDILVRIKHSNVALESDELSNKSKNSKRLSIIKQKGFVILIVLAVLVVIVAIVLLVLKMKKKRKSRVKYFPVRKKKE